MTRKLGAKDHGGYPKLEPTHLRDLVKLADQILIVRQFA